MTIVGVNTGKQVITTGSPKAAKFNPGKAYYLPGDSIKIAGRLPGQAPTPSALSVDFRKRLRERRKEVMGEIYGHKFPKDFTEKLNLRREKERKEMATRDTTMMQANPGFDSPTGGPGGLITHRRPAPISGPGGTRDPSAGLVSNRRPVPVSGPGGTKDAKIQKTSTKEPEPVPGPSEPEKPKKDEQDGFPWKTVAAVVVGGLILSWIK